MDFCLLGPVEALCGSLKIPVGPPKQQAVLAALLIDAGQVVTMDELIDRVWNGTPPDKARANIYAYVTQLRRVIHEASDGQPGPLARVGGGYLLDVDPHRVDVHRFLLLAAERVPSESDTDVVRRLRSCLDLWRGRPLGGLDGDWACRVRAWLEHQQSQAVVMLAEAHLRLGEAQEAVRVLNRASLAHPLNERLAAELIHAHLAAGQRVEALRTYTATRQRLVRELGVEPGTELRRLHQTVLAEQTPTRAGTMPLARPRHGHALACSARK
ncbi:BTAD domain-containing putative transcriptional regulator [Microbispora sp. NPDC049125]|uniref:AfsR/SARP family transcriptional regulator n=1 Tax=Microbispora sp. NPDC049125 TaxID=3154929 RepID=UPI0034655ACD